jgi:hypothetical protein
MPYMLSPYKNPCFITSDHLNIEYNEKTNPRWKISPSYVMLQKSCWFSYPTYIFQGPNTLLIMILGPNRRGIQAITFVRGFPCLNFFICFNREQNSATSLLSITHKWLIMMVWIRSRNGPRDQMDRPGPVRRFYSFLITFHQI